MKAKESVCNLDAIGE